MDTPLRVLLVEDNPGDALLIRDGLTAEPDECVLAVATTMRDAELAAGRAPFDVVLLDLQLPDSRGIVTLRRALTVWPSTPIVVLTGLDDDEVGAALIEEGAHDYVVKDELSERRLRRAVRFAVQRAQATAEAARPAASADPATGVAAEPPAGSGGDPAVGTIVGARYRLVRRIARGGSGVVYEGRDEVTGTPVAIKCLHPWWVDDARAVERFERESAVQRQLDHAAVVRVLDVVRTATGIALVLEFVDGPDLRAFSTSREAPETPRDVVALFLPLLDALAIAHAAGVVHRDIKPENVLVARTAAGFALRLIDFGIAKANDGGRDTRAGAVMGSLHAMAPEQFVDASTVDARADIYGLGCTLYEALTRRPPFTHDNEVRMLLAHLSEAAPSPRDFNPLVSEALAAVVLRAIAKAPGDRYPTCTAFAAALRGAVA